MVAIGFTLIFGVLGAVNFAHSEIYMLGAFAVLFAALAFAPPLIVLLLIVATVGVALGVGLDRIALRPLRRSRDEAPLKSRALQEATLLSSLAVGIIVRELTEVAFGGDKQPISDRLMINDPIPWGDVVFARGNFIIFATACITLVGLHGLLRHTRIGLGVRAVSDDLVGALYSGVNANRVIVWTFAIGSAIGAVAGLLVGLYYGAIATRGPMGLRGVPGLSLFAWRLNGRLATYFTIAAVTVGAVWVVHRLTYSPYGSALWALREDDQSAAGMGINTALMEVGAFAIGGGLAGAAGCLLAHSNGYISPDMFGLDQSILILTMVVVGGLGSLPGAVLGACALILLPELARGAGHLRTVLVGLVLYLSILLLPKGLIAEARALSAGKPPQPGMAP